MTGRTVYMTVLVSVCLVVCVLAQAQGQLSDSRLPGEPPPPYMLQWGSSGSGNGEFSTAVDVVLDSSGNAYVADLFNDRIQKFDSSGTYLGQWGTTGTAESQFAGPYGLAIDVSGNVYVADSDNNRIQKFDSSGTFVSAWGWGVDTGASAYEICTSSCQAGTDGEGNGELDRPWGVDVGPSGNVYVADTDNHRIQKFDSSGTYVDQWGSNGSSDGLFQFPADVAVDATETVYVADYASNRMQKFDSSGAFLGKWGTSGTGDGQFNSPGGVAVDKSGNVYVADAANFRIQKFDRSGTFLTRWGSIGTGNGQFSFPFGAAIDVSGNVYVADNHRIQKFGPVPDALVFLSKWGASGNGAGQLNGAAYPAVDASGNIYVAERYNHRIQKFDSSGAFVSMWGWGVDDGTSEFQVCTAATVPCQGGISGSSDGQFDQPYSVAVDGSSYVYVADSRNRRIQKFDTSGNFVSVWGWGVDDGTAAYQVCTSSCQAGIDGSGAGQFGSTNGLAVDTSGNVYAAESDNRIQKLDSSGNFLAVWGWSVDDGTSEFQICTPASLPCQAGLSGGQDRQLNTPVGIDVDSSGNIYVFERYNYRVQKFDSSFALLRMWGWGVDDGSSEFQVCTGSCQAGTNGSGDGQFDFSYDLAVDASGNVYVADRTNHRIQKFDSSGTFLTKWGTLCNTGVSGVDGCDSRYDLAMGVVADALGKVYTVDWNNYRIQKHGRCSFAAIPGSDTSVFGGGTDSFNVDAIVDACGWKATSDDAWIQVTSSPSYIGDSTLNYSVDANPTGLGRVGTITVADLTTGGAGTTFTVSQDPAPCTFGLSPTGATPPGAGTSDSVTVTTLVGCAWTAVSNDGWITVDGGTPGNGSGTVLYTVAANAVSAARSGSMTIGGITFTVNQDPQIPDAPSNLAAVASSRTKVNLTWDDNSGNESEFQVERKMGAGGTYARISTLPSDTTGMTDSPLDPSTTYFYRVLACNSAGCSAASGEVSVTTPSLGYFIGEEQ